MYILYIYINKHVLSDYIRVTLLSIQLIMLSLSPSVNNVHVNTSRQFALALDVIYIQ